MVQTYQSPVRVYKHPFELVMAAYHKRFPTCPQIPIFVGSEILDEFHSEDGAEEMIERKCQLNVDAPYLLKKMAGVDYVYFNQKNSLDRRKRTLIIEATNISFSSRLVILEKCVYYVHPENAEWTCFEQSASLDVKSFFGFESAVEKLAVKQYSANIAKGKEILEFFITDLIKDGVTYLPPFEETTTNIQKSPADSAIDLREKNNDEDTDASSESTEKFRTARRESVKSAEPEKKADEKRRRSTSKITHQNSASTSGVRAGSFDETEVKLETEYIQRFLGELTPLEESRLCELKYGLQHAHKGKLPNDAHLLRFLRARDFDVKLARDMVINSLLWRKQHNIDQLLHEFDAPPVLRAHFPGRWHHEDRAGRPLFVLRLGQMDVKGLLKSVGLEKVLKFTLSICEQGLERAADATKRLGKPISTWTLLVDLEGLGVRHLWRPGVQCLLRIIETVEAHYPETMGLVLISRAPRMFPVLWTLISPFIDENTRRKFMINTSEHVLDELSKYIPREHLPAFLGGPCAFEASAGGHVPKADYLPVSEAGALGSGEEGDVLASTYTLATVHRGLPQEALVHVPTAGCVLTWDFDVIKGSCEFCVYHTSKVLDQPAPPVSPTTLNPVERITSAIEAVSLSSPAHSVVAVDPELKLGEDLTIQEQPVILSEGDSMQGSHYCAQAGSYILQWKVADHPPQPHQHAAFDFSLTGPKCKLMFYHELLDSENFRGSVASLASCRSSFSSLAAAEGRHSGSVTPTKK